jgi:hypothetical protein
VEGFSILYQTSTGDWSITYIVRGQVFRTYLTTNDDGFPPQGGEGYVKFLLYIFILLLDALLLSASNEALSLRRRSANSQYRCASIFILEAWGTVLRELSKMPGHKI